MKVFELMKALSECPAGATVEISQLMTIAELTENGVSAKVEGKEYYQNITDVGEIPKTSAGTVYLYTD